MTAVEIKAAIFDVLKEMEALQVKVQELVKKKSELLKQLGALPEEK